MTTPGSHEEDQTARVERDVRRLFAEAATPSTPASIRAYQQGFTTRPSSIVVRRDSRLGVPIGIAVVVLISIATGLGVAQLAGRAGASPVLELGSLFVPGQAEAGPGWRLIAGDAALRPGTLTAPDISLLEGAPAEALLASVTLPSKAPSFDPKLEALVVADLFVGVGDGLCRQIRIDRVTVDLPLGRVDLGYEFGAALATELGQAPVACRYAGVAATALVAVPLDSLPRGTVTLRLQVADDTVGWLTIAERMTTR